MTKIKAGLNSTKQFIKKLWKDESAQGMIEYILILVVVVIIGSAIRTQMKTTAEDAALATDEAVKGFFEGG